MHRKTPVSQQVYNLLYPSGPKTDNDPPSFSLLARSHLAKEAKHEARMYYGEDDRNMLTLPGLDYNSPSHRRRLLRWRHHRRLFEAIDKLCLTAWEIYELCDWDGTLYKKDMYLKLYPQQRVALEDDTGADLPTWEEVQVLRAAEAVAERVKVSLEEIAAALSSSQEEVAEMALSATVLRDTADGGEADESDEDVEDDEEDEEVSEPELEDSDAEDLDEECHTEWEVVHRG